MDGSRLWVALCNQLSCDRHPVTMAATNFILCLYYATIDITHLFMPVRPCCPHSKSHYARKPTLRISKSGLVFYLLLTLTLMCMTITCISDLMETCRVDKALCLVIAADEFFSTTSMATGVLFVCNATNYCTEIESWCQTILNGKMYGLDDVIDDKIAKKIVTTRNCCLYAFWSIGFYTFTIYFGFSWYDNLSWNVIRKLVLIAGICLQVYMILEFSDKFIIAGSVLDAIKRSLKMRRCFSKHVLTICAISRVNRLAECLITGSLSTWTLSTIVYLICKISSLIIYSDKDLSTIILLLTNEVL